MNVDNIRFFGTFSVMEACKVVEFFVRLGMSLSIIIESHAPGQYPVLELPAPMTPEEWASMNATLKRASITINPLPEKKLIDKLVYGVSGAEILNESYIFYRKMGLGRNIVSHVSAPGTGMTISRITRIDEDGIYGIELCNTVRELRASEVR